MSERSTGIVPREMRRVEVALLLAALFVGAYADSARAQQAAAKPGDGRLYVVTFIDLTPPNAEAGRSVIQQYVADTKKDSGIVRIEAMTQDSRQNHFVVFAVWQDQKAFDAHESAAHTKDFRAKLTP